MWVFPLESVKKLSPTVDSLRETQENIMQDYIEDLLETYSTPPAEYGDEELRADDYFEV